MPNDDLTVQDDIAVHDDTKGGADEQSKETKVDPSDQMSEPEQEQKQEKDKTEPVETVTDEFVKNTVTEKLGDFATDEIIKDFTQQLKAIGITDAKMAERAIDYVANSRITKITADSEKTLAHFGATEGNITPEYQKAIDEARTAITALDSKIQGLKQVIDLNGLGANLQMVLMFQSLLPYVGEDAPKANEANSPGKAEEGFMDTVFKNYPSEKK